MSEKTNNQVLENLVEEAKGKADITRILALGHYATATVYGSFNFWVGMLNTALAAAAGASALTKVDETGILTSILSVSVAVITALLTFLSPVERNKFHWNAGAEFEVLSDRFYMLINVTCNTDKSYQDIENNFEDLLQKYHKARSAYPIPTWAYQFAKKELTRKGGKESLRPISPPK